MAKAVDMTTENAIPAIPVPVRPGTAQPIENKPIPAFPTPFPKGRVCHREWPHPSGIEELPAGREWRRWWRYQTVRAAWTRNLPAATAPLPRRITEETRHV